MKVQVVQETVSTFSHWFNNVPNNIWYRLLITPLKGDPYLSYGAYVTETAANQAKERRESR